MTASQVTKSLRPPRFRWTLMLACNHYRNGMFQGYVESVSLGCGRGDFRFGTDYLDNHELTLSGPRVRLAFSKKSRSRARLGSVVFEFCGYKEWVGNWCWDAMFVERKTVREIARTLKSQSWTCESASGLLIDWFDRLE